MKRLLMLIVAIVICTTTFAQTKKEKIEFEEKKEQERKKFKENPFEIPEYMIKEFIYSPNIKEAIHLIPSEELIQKAFKSIVERYMNYVKEINYRRIERIGFSHLEVVERSLLYREFSYIFLHFMLKK